MPERAQPTARVVSEDQIAFRGALLDAGILPSGVKGIYGKGPSFVAAFEGLDRFVTAAGCVDEPEVYRFPAVFPVDHLVRSDYLRSFPDLVGSIHGFEGGNKEHAALLRDVADGADWDGHSRGPNSCSSPACYPLYPMVSGELPPGGRLFDVLGTCFRHEPSDDPARMQAFQMHEFVHIGAPESVLAFRDDWLSRQQQMMDDLGLKITVEVANDPFFGRAGSMLAANQRERVEVRAARDGVERSATHRDRFVQPPHGSPHRKVRDLRRRVALEAHSACVGFGLERIVLALFAAHGLDAGRWPHDVSKRLWP